MVDPLVREHVHQVHPLRVQHPLRGGGETALVRRHHLLGLPQSDLADVRHTLQLELAQHRLLDALQEDVIIREVTAVALLLVAPFTVDRFVVHDADAQDQLLGVVVRKNTRQILPELLVDAVGHIDHGEILVDHHLAVEFDAQEPGAHPGGVDILVRHVKVGMHEVRILLDQSSRRVGVVVDLGGPRHVVQRRVLERALHLLRRLLVLRGGPGEVHREAGRLDVLGDVDDLHEPGHSQRDILR